MTAKWRKRFMELARHVAGWSKDPSTQVGCVIVRPDRSVAALGFNGFARGVSDSKDRLDNRNEKLLHVLHAELNAILSAKASLERCYLFVWPFPPCSHCAGAIIQSGISVVFCPKHVPERWVESCKAARQAFFEAGVELHLI